MKAEVSGLGERNQLNQHLTFFQNRLHLNKEIGNQAPSTENQGY